MSKKINGCGPAILGLNKLVPNFCFKHACNLHDLNYRTPGVNRKEADKYFFRCMIREANKKEKFKLFYIQMACLYYLVVRLFGGIFRKIEK